MSVNIVHDPIPPSEPDGSTDVLSVVEAEPMVHTAVRWWPPENPRHSDNQTSLLANGHVGQVGDEWWLYGDGVEDRLDPGDWVICEEQPDGSTIRFILSDDSFRKMYRLA